MSPSIRRVYCLATGAMHFASLRFPGLFNLNLTKLILERVWVAIIPRAWKSDTSLKLGPLKRGVISTMHRLHLPVSPKSLGQLIHRSGGEHLFFALCLDVVNVEGQHVLTTSSEGVLFGSVIGLEGLLGVLAECSFNVVSDWRWYLHQLLHVKIIKSTFDR